MDLEAVGRDVPLRWPAHVGEAWEDLARSTLPSLRLDQRRWRTGERYWGKDTRGGQIELDLIAEAVDDPRHALVGQVKHRTLHYALWILEGKRPSAPRS